MLIRFFTRRIITTAQRRMDLVASMVLDRIYPRTIRILFNALQIVKLGDAAHLFCYYLNWKLEQLVGLPHSRMTPRTHTSAGAMREALLLTPSCFCCTISLLHSIGTLLPSSLCLPCCKIKISTQNMAFYIHAFFFSLLLYSYTTCNTYNIMFDGQREYRCLCQQLSI